MKCPHCNVKLENEAIEAIVSPTTFKKYLTFVKNYKINSSPLLLWCPNASCEEIIELEAADVLKGICGSCGFEVCPKCNHQYHGDVSCENAVDKEIDMWCHNRDVQNCSKCKMLVEKQ